MDIKVVEHRPQPDQRLHQFRHPAGRHRGLAAGLRCAGHHDADGAMDRRPGEAHASARSRSTAPTGGDVDLIATGAIRSGEIAAYLEMRDHVLVQAQTQLDEIAAAHGARAVGRDDRRHARSRPGAQPGFDIDTAGLLAGNTVHLTYTDNLTGTQRTRHHRAGRRSGGACRLTNTATTDPNDQVIGVDFSGGLGVGRRASSTARLQRRGCNSPIRPARRCASSTTARPTIRRQRGRRRPHTVTVAHRRQRRVAVLHRCQRLPIAARSPSIGPQSVGFAGRIAVNASLLADPSQLVVFQTGR